MAPVAPSLCLGFAQRSLDALRTLPGSSAVHEVVMPGEVAAPLWLLLLSP